MAHCSVGMSLFLSVILVMVVTVVKAAEVAVSEGVLVVSCGFVGNCIGIGGIFVVCG